MTIESLPVWTFEANWTDDVVESLEFFTKILTSKSGAEQRNAHRNTPRRMLEFKVSESGTARTLMNNFIELHGGSRIYLPLWFDQYETTLVSPSGAKNLFVPIVDVMLSVDDVVFITNGDPLVYELAEIASFAADRIVTKANLTKTWDVGTRVFKLVQAQFVDQPSLEEMSSLVDEGNVKFLVMEANPWEIQVVETFGPLINQGTSFVSHSYHDLSDPTGRTEEQFMMAAAFFAAWDAIKDEPGAEYDDAARYYRELAQGILDAIGDGEDRTPILRYPVSADSEFLNLPNYRFAARSNAPIGDTPLTETFTAVDNVLFIPDASGTEDPINRVWQIYPATAELFFPMAWAPSYDYEVPTVDLSFEIDDWVETVDGVSIPIPVTAPDDIDDWNVVYSYDSTEAVEIGNAFQLLPAISRVRNETAVYAGDISHWSERALTRAITMDGRAGMDVYWSRVRAQFRKTDLKGRRVDDQRWIFQQMPLVDALPPLDDVPKGFFSYSDHPGAVPPTAVESMDSSWTGYNFWSRDTNGDLIATTPVPGALSRVQFGRKFAEQWRQAETYQDPDQYLYVSISCTRKPVLASGEYFLIWMSSSEDDEDETDRWFADIGSKVAFVATALASAPIEFLIPLSDFKKRTYNGAGVSLWGATMPAGQIIKSFGISAEFNNNISIRLREMRLLAGPNAGWVTTNLAKAKKGYAMAFAPGVTPSLINLNIDQQRFNGMNFSPMHGYQFADYWKIAETEANTIYAGLTINDLPIPNRVTNAIEYPISATTAGAVTKTAAALLMEQQLRFLDHAQKEYDADGGDLGPFAHTYTMNTYDRLLFKDEAHSKWVYENFRPYTQWGGFQYRIAEGLAQAIELMGATTTYADSKALAITLLTGFTTWLNVAWPNLTGSWAGFDGLRVYSGDESDYVHRFTGDENPFVEVYSE